MGDLNWWAVVVAAVSSFLLGGLWYSPVLFGKVWNRENGSDPKAMKGHPARVFGVSFFWALVAAATFAHWIGPEPSVKGAVGCGALAGFGFVAASFGINYQFAGRSTLLWLIDAGYHVVQFALFGLVLGLWH